MRTKPIGRYKESLEPEKVRIIENFLGKMMIRYGYPLSREQSPLFQIIKYWLRNRQKRKQIGVLLRLYWPFRLPDRFVRG